MSVGAVSVERFVSVGAVSVKRSVSVGAVSVARAVSVGAVVSPMSVRAVSVVRPMPVGTVLVARPVPIRVVSVVGVASLSEAEEITQVAESDGRGAACAAAAYKIEISKWRIILSVVRCYSNF